MLLIYSGHSHSNEKFLYSTSKVSTQWRTQPSMEAFNQKPFLLSWSTRGCKEAFMCPQNYTYQETRYSPWVHTWNFKGYHSTVSNIIIYWLCTRKPSRRFLLILWNKIICYVWHGKFYVELKLVNCWTNCQIN